MAHLTLRCGKPPVDVTEHFLFTTDAYRMQTPPMVYDIVAIPDGHEFIRWRDCTGRAIPCTWDVDGTPRVGGKVYLGTIRVG